MQNFQDQLIIIPNKNIFQNPIENYSLLGKRRLDLSRRVVYNSDLEQVEQITLASLKGIKGLTDDAITKSYKEFDESSISYVIRIWIQSPERPEYWKVRKFRSFLLFQYLKVPPLFLIL